jgi:hypothetical protein
MASILNPSNGQYIINGDVEINGDITASDGDLNISKVRIDSTSDIDLENIPANYEDADAALNVAGGAYIGGNLYTGGTFVANGDVVTLGNTGGSLTFNANVSSDIIPSEDGVYSIGEQAHQWRVIQTRGIRINANPLPIDAITWDDHGALSYVTAATPFAVSLQDGANGQIKLIVCTETPVSTVVITPNNPLGFSNFIFTEAGQTVTLLFTGGSWLIISYYRATVTYP